MSVNRRLRVQVLSEIGELIATGRESELKELRQKYRSKVPRATFYRWCKALRKKEPAQIKVVKRKEHSIGSNSQTEPGEQPSSCNVARPADCSCICRTPLDALEELYLCLSQINELAQVAVDGSGAIRRPDLYGFTIRERRYTALAINRITDASLNRQKMLDMVHTITRAIRELDPDLATRIAARLNEITKTWGGTVA